MQSKILIIKGSARKKGNTQLVVDAIRAKIPTTYIDLQDHNISYYDYEHKNQADDFLGIAKQMTEHDIIIFATPIYWYSMSAILKTFFDRLSDLLTIRKDLGRGLKGKKVYVVACSSDESVYEHFFMPFEKTATYLEMEWCGGVHTWIEEDQLPSAVRLAIKNLIFSLEMKNPN